MQPQIWCAERWTLFLSHSCHKGIAIIESGETASRPKRSLAGYRPWGCQELGTAEHTHTTLKYNWPVLFKVSRSRKTREAWKDFQEIQRRNAMCVPGCSVQITLLWPYKTLTLRSWVKNTREADCLLSRDCGRAFVHGSVPWTTRNGVVQWFMYSEKSNYGKKSG